MRPKLEPPDYASAASYGTENIPPKYGQLNCKPFAHHQRANDHQSDIATKAQRG